VVVTENIAANGGGDNLGTSRIYRVTPMGVVTLIATDDSNDNVGFYASRGIVYSESSGYLFISSSETCIYAMDLDGTMAPNPFINTTPGQPKVCAMKGLLRHTS